MICGKAMDTEFDRLGKPSTREGSIALVEV